MAGRRFRFLARHGRALFVWAVIIIAGVQLWLVPFGVGASSAIPSHTVQQGQSAPPGQATSMGGWTPIMSAELHTHLHLIHHK